MSNVTTQVFDTTRGQPADGLPVALERHDGQAWKHVGGAVTNDSGLTPDLMLAGELARGTYRLTFDTGTYFAANDMTGFYPVIRIVFEVAQDHEHHHLPLMLSPYGYSTHRTNG